MWLWFHSDQSEKYAKKPFYWGFKWAIAGPFSMAGSKLPRILASQICKTWKIIPRGKSNVYRVYTIVCVANSRKYFLYLVTLRGLFFAQKRLCLATLYTLGPWYEHIDLDWSIRLMRNSAVQLPSPREKGVLVWCWQSSSPLGRMEELFHVFHRCYSYPPMYYALLFHVLLVF